MFKVEHIGTGMYEVLARGNRVAVFNTTETEDGKNNAQQFADFKNAPLEMIDDSDSRIATSVLRALLGGHQLGLHIEGIARRAAL